MMSTNTKQQGLDEATKARVELVVKVFTGIPSEKEPLFLAIANAYLDGLIAGQELKESSN